MPSAATLMVSWNRMNRWMFSYSDRPQRTALTMLANESSSRTMSLASLATSVPAAHRQADVRLVQRRGVVGAVAGDGDDVAVVLEQLDHPQLVQRPGAGSTRERSSRRGMRIVTELGEVGSVHLCVEGVTWRRAGRSAGRSRGRCRVVAGDDLDLDPGRRGRHWMAAGTSGRTGSAMAAKPSHDQELRQILYAAALILGRHGTSCRRNRASASALLVVTELTFDAHPVGSVQRLGPLAVRACAQRATEDFRRALDVQQARPGRRPSARACPMYFRSVEK